MTTSKRWAHRSVALAVTAALWAASATAEFYRYVDPDGTVHYVDDPGLIPGDQQPTVRTYEEPYDQLDPEERERRIREERRRAESEEAADRVRRETERLSGGGLESPVTIAGNQVLVPATLGFKGRELEVTFLLDTGASMTTLHKGAVSPLRVYGGIPVRMQVVGGKTIPSTVVQFDFIRVGPMTVENIHASVLDHRGGEVRYQGLLGMNFLKYADYAIDYDRQVITWRPKPMAMPPGHGGGGG